MRKPFWWGLLFSLAANALLLLFVASYAPAHTEDSEITDVIVSHLTPAIVKTPRPTPTPTVRPVATPSAPPARKPIARVPMPAAAPLRINVPHTTAQTSGASSEQTYVQPARGSENGAPGGTGSGSGTAAEPSPTPTCAEPRVLAHVIHEFPEEYPEAAVESGASGVVLVEVTLSETGAVLATRIARSSGNRALDMAGIDAANRSQYAPDFIDCRPAGGDYIFRVIFQPQ